MSNKLSVLMITKNERHNIKECLDTVQGWADEIIVVDDESSDNTLQAARQYTDNVHTRKMDLEGRQRNWAVSKARNDWVMFIDADERVTKELQGEINEILSKAESNIVAFWIPRKNYLGNFWLRHGGWYPAPHIKLYNKHHLKWMEVPADVVHPGIEITKGYQSANLKNHLIHYNFKDIEDFINKVNRQSTLEAMKWHLQGKRITLMHGLWKGFERFWKRFIYKKGFKDGYHGFAASFLSGFYQWAAYSKWREIKEKASQNPPLQPPKREI
jgi:glycosyltransferase involved in cell wall biosynthesis